MKFNLVDPKEKPCLKVSETAYNQWFEIDNVHFIRMGIHDDEICCYGTLVRDNHKSTIKTSRQTTMTMIVSPASILKSRCWYMFPSISKSMTMATMK